MAEDEGFVCSENYLIFSVSLKGKTRFAYFMGE